VRAGRICDGSSTGQLRRNVAQLERVLRGEYRIGAPRRNLFASARKAERRRPLAQAGFRKSGARFFDRKLLN
jgi:hypothetical protein